MARKYIQKEPGAEGSLSLCKCTGLFPASENITNCSFLNARTKSKTQTEIKISEKSIF